jgi:hypothetical protein
MGLEGAGVLYQAPSEGPHTVAAQARKEAVEPSPSSSSLEKLLP